MKKTKVFDLGLFVDNMKNKKISHEVLIDNIEDWALERHGLTEEEMNEKGYYFIPEWMKEVEVKFELTGQEIAVLEALEVLDFKWIARDKDDILYAHGSKPKKNICSYGDLEHACHLNKDLFKFITWEDEEATSIEELLCGLK